MNHLGATNPAIKAAANTNLYTNPSTSPGVYVEPTGPVGYTRWGIQELRNRAWADIVNRGRAMQASLEQTFGPQIVGWKQANIYGITRCIDPNKTLTFWPGLAAPLGVINVMNYPFTPLDLNNDTVSVVRDYIPLPDQRFAAETAVYFASQRDLFKELTDNYIDDLPHAYLTYAYPTIGLSLSKVGGEFATRLAEGVSTLKRSKMTLRTIIAGTAYIAHPSGPVKKISGPYTPNPAGYGMISVLPTEEELDSADGLMSFYNRGGFLIREAVLRGREPVSASAPLWWTEGYYRCPPAQPDDPAYYRREDADHSNQIRPYLQSEMGDESSGWVIFTNFDPVPGGMIHLRVQPKDMSLKNAILSKLASGMKALGTLICNNQDKINTANQKALVASNCTDTKTGMPCSAPSATCHCSPPMPSGNAMVDAARIATAMWCAKGGISSTPNQSAVQPFIPPVVPEAPPTMPGTIFTFSAKRGNVYRVAIPTAPTTGTIPGLLGEAAPQKSREIVAALVMMGAMVAVSVGGAVVANRYRRKERDLGDGGECAIPIYWMGPASRRKYGVKVGALTRVATKYHTHYGKVIDYGERSLTVRTPNGSQYTGDSVAVSCEPWMSRYEHIRRL